jgi:hypothetical protein
MRQRTALYVYEPSTVAIRAKDPAEAELLLYRYGRKRQQVAPGALALDRGIYMILSRGELDITGGNVHAIALASDKDVPPEPRAQVVGLEQGATPSTIQTFFEVFKGIDVDGPPVGSTVPAGPGTSKITDDPDGI